MVSICVICLVKEPPLMPLSAEHRQLLEAIISPVMNTLEFKDHTLLHCGYCKVLMTSMYSFQQTALRGAKTLRNLLRKVDKESTQRDVKPIFQETQITVTIKAEPEPETEMEFEVPQVPIVKQVPDPLLKQEPDIDTDSTESCESEPEIVAECNMPVKSPFVPQLITVEPINRKPVMSSVIQPKIEPGLEPIIRVKRLQSIQDPRVHDRGTKDPKVPPVPVVPKSAHAPANDVVCEVFTHRTKEDRLPQTQTQTQEPSGPQLPYLTSIRWRDGVRGLLAEKRERVYKTDIQTCPYCGKRLKNKQILKAHVLRIHEQDPDPAPVNCGSCGVQCRNKYHLRTHMNKHKKESRTIDDMKPDLYCVECSIQFDSPSAYKTHRLCIKHIPRDQFKFECEICKKRFASQHRLQKHASNVHVQTRRFKCDQCDKRFGSAWGMRHHVMKLHDKTVKRTITHICHLCGKDFTIKKGLEEHLHTHEGLRPFKCELCPSTFSYSAALFMHNRLKHLKIKGKWKKKEKKQENAEQEGQVRRGRPPTGQARKGRAGKTGQARKGKLEGQVGKGQEGIEGQEGIGQEEKEVREAEKEQENEVDMEEDFQDVDSFFNTN